MSYDPNEVPRIRQAWVRRGSVPCESHIIEREYIPGIGRADYFCTVCGQSSPTSDDLR